MRGTRSKLLLCLIHSSTRLATLTLHLMSVQVTAFGVITQNGVTGILPTGVQFTFSGPPSYNEASSIDSSGASAPSSAPQSPAESPPESSPESSIQSDIASASAGGASASAGGSSQVNAAPACQCALSLQHPVNHVAACPLSTQPAWGYGFANAMIR